MKRLVALLAIALPMLAQQAAPPVGDVTLAWTSLQPLSTGTVFQLRGQSVLSGNSNFWPIITNVSGLSTTATVRITPGQFYFVVTPSNMWGIFPPSNVAATDPLPLPPLLTIQGAR